ncbi:MAG: cytochrome P450 [Acidimicrobiaceae bacterium]|nr:cytochrome P450 [Acidimicrobiaceae bacterium]
MTYTTDTSTTEATDDSGAGNHVGPEPRAPVTDWATDFDHVDPGYAARAPEIWDELRSECPVAHSDRYGGAWLPVRHADVCAIAKDTDTFSSNGVVVHDGRPEIPPPVGFAPPITSDPPFHRIAREFLLPAFAPKPIEAKRESTRETCRELLDDLLADVESGRTGIVDAALGYTQHIPVRVMADMLGVPRSDGDQFRIFIHQIMEAPGTGLQVDYEESIDFYLDTLIAARAEEPRDDLISHMTHAKIEGHSLQHEHIRGTCGLLIIAGVDTTWSAIGASLWHLAQHPADRRRWIEDPEVRPFAVEEFLRFYAPVTMARLVAKDAEFAGRSMRANDWVLLPFPAANRDPEAFEDAGEFVIDRMRNRHVAFGLGIHRCLGSNLARMELTVALEEWMARVPDFELADPAGVTWSTGQIRGPRRLPVRILNGAAARISGEKPVV